MRLDGRVALVTGAGGPMGGTISRRFAAEGAWLALTDISGTRLQLTVEALQGAGREVVWQRADVTRDEEVAPLVDAAIARFGRIDVLVNVVGGIRGQLYEPMAGMDAGHWRDTFALNLDGCFHLVRRVAPQMTANGYGRIVNFSSVAFAGEPGQAHYSAAKAAVAAMTRSLARELAPAVTVNAVAPGLIRTSVMPRLPAEEIDRLVGQTMLGRPGEPEEIAAAVLFLASEEASYITGETLRVSGGIPAAL